MFSVIQFPGSNDDRVMRFAMAAVERFAEPWPALAGARTVPARRIGETGGDRLRIGPPQGDRWIDAPIARLRALWERGIPRRLEVS